MQISKFVQTIQLDKLIVEFTSEIEWTFSRRTNAQRWNRSDRAKSLSPLSTVFLHICP